jgi:uncharacterized protein
VTIRRVRFEFPDDLDASWHPTFPEFAAAANGVSMLMPHVEPYVVSSIRAVKGSLEQPLAERAQEFIAQETQHQRQHRRFNDLLVAQVRSLDRIDRFAGAIYRWLGRVGSDRFNVAFAAGAETTAFSMARWSESHLRELFDRAEPVVSTLFLWHLAEEVEHKCVAYDVHRCVGGGRLLYLFAGWISVLVMALVTVMATVAQLVHSGRILSPVAWWRLTRWAFSLAFTVLPDLFVSALPGHHPSQFSDPILLGTWLGAFDPR